jgi:cysteine desulfurase/selenocysteine lyase
MQAEFPLVNDTTAYLDNAATTQKPRVVLDALTEFYETSNANPHRSMYDLANDATTAVENARQTYADALNAHPEEIFFTRNATESLNHIAHGLKHRLDENSEILTTILEHHSNLLPWQAVAEATGASLTILPRGQAHNIAAHVSDNTEIVTVTHMSNVTGEQFDIQSISQSVKQQTDAAVIADGCQAYPHQQVNVNNLGVDAYTFSAHKHYGPNGVGITYLDAAHHDKFTPHIRGGGMVNSVSQTSYEQSTPPHGFEAGTLNAAGIVASAKAAELVEAHRDDIAQHEAQLKTYLENRLDDADISYYDSPHPRGPVISLNTRNDAYDIAHILNDHDVCIRAGNHCADPLMSELERSGTARISLAYYNTQDDIDQTLHALQEATNLLGGPL